MSVNIGSTAQEILNEINNKVDKITYEAVATTSTAGLMSAADKTKLDNVLTLSSVREDSRGNVVVSNDLKVQGGADFTNDVTMGSLTVDAGLQMNDDVEINYQYGIRWTDDNDSGLVSISRNEDTGKLEVHYANNSLPSGALATIGADQIKGIYLTGENRTIVGAEPDVGIIWEGDGTLFKDENAITEITETHFMTRVPIVAGNNVTFETDTENQVVKINSAGALVTDTDVRVNNLTVTGITSLNGDVAIFNGNPLKLFSEGNSGSIYLRNEEGKLTVEGEAVALVSDIPTDYVDLSSAQTISGKKHFKTGSGYSTPELATMFFGPSANTGFAFGNDGLQTFSNGNYSTMYVNYYGGNVDIGRSGSTANVNLYGTVKENGVALSEKYALKSEVGSGGETDSSIIDLGVQSSHKEAQQAIVDYVISQSAEDDCYLFKYWCSCYNNACFAVVYNWGTDDEIYVEGTVYDNQSSYRRFLYKNGEFTVDGCWLNIASWDEERDNLTTEEKNVIAAINEINAKVPTKIENGDASVEVFDTSDIVMSGRNVDVLVSSFLASNESSGSCILVNSGGVDIEGEVLDVIGGTISIRDADSVNRIYLDEVDGLAINGSQINIETPTGNDEMARLSSDTVEIYGKSNVDLYASNGSVSINSPKGNTSIDGKTLSLRINNTYGTAGQVLMSDGEYAYWGDVEGSSGGGSPMTPITYAELKALRDSGKLVAGMFYRITDYVCTTVQAETRAMSNRFDIIVQALSNNTLSETAKADYNAEDNYFKIESGGNALVEGSVTKYYDIYEDCDDIENKTANYKSNDTFVEYGYLENNEGVTVPVLYKNEIDSYADEGADYGDTFYYVGTYEYEGTTYDRWRKIEASGYGWDSTGKIYALTNVIVENNEIISSVKAGGIKYNANLPAWELKYCLDNDTTRFAWALDGQAITNLYSVYSNGRPLVRQPSMDGRNPSEDESFNIYNYAWGTQEDVDDDDGTSFVYSLNPTITNGEVVYNANDGELPTAEVIEGKGVIYYMKDEHNNECPYDFKNIQFKRSTEWQEEHSSFVEDNLYLSVGDVEWFYTFSWVNEDLSVDDLTLRQDLMNDEGLAVGTKCNVIGDSVELGIGLLNNNLMISSYQCDTGLFFGCVNTFGRDCYLNTIGNKCSNNTFGNGCHNTTFGNACNNNTFGNACNNNTFGNACNNNTFGNSCNNNTFGNDCTKNTFGDDCSFNTFGNYCTENVLHGKNFYIRVGGSCNMSEFESVVSDITLKGLVIGAYFEKCSGVTISGDATNIRVCQGMVDVTIEGSDLTTYKPQGRTVVEVAV